MNQAPIVPASRIAFNDDGTAWWVLPSAAGIPFQETASGFTGIRGADRPCDAENCRGGVVQYPEWEGDTQPCADCAGTGRHMFEIEVGLGYAAKAVAHIGETNYEATRTHRVSIVPGMVVPIEVQHPPCGLHAYESLADPGRWVICRSGQRKYVTFPPDDAPGLWAVCLVVHT